MGDLANFSIETDGDQTVFVFNGPLLIATISDLDDELRAYDAPVHRIDISAVTPIDTVGAWVLHRFAERHGAQISGASNDAQLLIDAVANCAPDSEIVAPRLPLFTRVAEGAGAKVFEFLAGARRNLGFLGAMLVALRNVLFNWRRFPVLATVRQMELVGVSALPIVGLMSFLIGIVIAQQGAVQLAQFGAEALTVDLVGRITLRELGVLMTAIMVAGRSGSAFAAQIGTMKLTEEVDAMRTIGVSAMERLVVPRILASVLMMPLLGFYSACLGIIGGAVISDIMLDIPFWTFLSRIQEVVPIYDLYVGLVKAPVFGLIVAMSGCYQGMQVKGNAEEVGLRTTKAVVQAIFLVIVLDAFFAVFFTEVGWG